MAAHFVERLLVLVRDPSCHDAVLAKGMITGIGSEIKNDKSDPRYRECALEALRLLSKHHGCPAKVDACPGLRQALDRLAADASQPRLQSKAAAVLEGLAGASPSERAAEAGGPSKAAAPAQASQPMRTSMFAAAAAAAGPPKMRTVTVDMSGLLPLPGAPGAKEVTEAYTHALLLVPGVTSVSIDAVSFRAIVFVRCASSEDVRPGLLAAVNSVQAVQAEQERETGEAAGVSSPAVPSSSALMYLEEEEEDDFFGDGAVAQRRGRETVEERLARQRQEMEAESAAEADGGVLGGLAKGVASWIGMGW